MAYVKYCKYCGADLPDGTYKCVRCGKYSYDDAKADSYSDPLDPIIKLFLVIGCIIQGWTLLPLLWCIPITVILFRKMNNNEYIDNGIKICALLFVNLVAGICLLCRKER